MFTARYALNPYKKPFVSSLKGRNMYLASYVCLEECMCMCHLKSDVEHKQFCPIAITTGSYGAMYNTNSAFLCSHVYYIMRTGL